MKIVAALTDPDLVGEAEAQGADMIEIRLDLIESNTADRLAACREVTKLPIICTLRSSHEGGRYFGSAEEWIGRLRPLLPYFDYVDVEQKFSVHAPEIRCAGKGIIASFHTPAMPPLFSLFVLERELRAYGDIVKIIATPRTDDDIIELISFTHAVKMPICTGVMGPQFRYARAILALFGSELVYCHLGTPTAEGQYSVSEFAGLMRMLGSR